MGAYVIGFVAGGYCGETDHAVLNIRLYSHEGELLAEKNITIKIANP